MIVIINPNSTVAMTVEMTQTARRAAPDAQINGWTSHDGPPAIQGEADGQAAVPPLLHLVGQANEAGARAVIIGCFDDTGLDQARAMSSCPVIGIGQAAYHLAALIGPRFSVVTTLEVSIPVLDANITAYGLANHAARVRASGVPVLSLETDRARATQDVIAEINTAAAQDNINSVVLGCAGMGYIKDQHSDQLDVPVIDGVAAAVLAATLL